MAISKRLRFEILKRDGSACRYCGAMAPDAKLTVDHVTPVALGGSDEPSNLVTACRDCNAGKSSTSPTEAVVQGVSDDDIRWAAAIRRVADDLLEQQREEKTKFQWFIDQWVKWDPDRDYMPADWKSSVACWVNSGLPPEVLIDCLDIALANRGVSHYKVFAYMGGIARNRIEKLHDSARALLDGEQGVRDGA